MQCNTIQYNTIQYRHYNTIYPCIHACITSHHITLHHITSHYITLHYTTLHYITLHTYIHTHRQTASQAGRQTGDRQPGRQTDRQQTDRQTDIPLYIFVHIYHITCINERERQKRNNMPINSRETWGFGWWAWACYWYSLVRLCLLLAYKDCEDQFAVV